MTATAHLDRQRPPPIITLPAELDVATSPATAKALAAAIRPGIPIIVADMTHTIYCDSAANQVLLRAHHDASANHTDLRVVAPHPAVRRVFQLIGTDQILHLYPTLSRALTTPAHR